MRSEKRFGVLIVKRKDSDVTNSLAAVLIRLFAERYGLRVFVEREAAADLAPYGLRDLRVYDAAAAREARQLTHVITLGGDGTTLWAVSLLPELRDLTFIAVRLGALSYINQLEVADLELLFEELFGAQRLASFERVQRTALSVAVRGADGALLRSGKALNECSVDRGGSPCLCKLEVKINGVHYLTLAADGLIVATPTGSTAYNMATGASVVHPAVDCLVLSPICPHSLNMRSIVLPAALSVSVSVSAFSRADAKVRVDGHAFMGLVPGLELLVERHPVCAAFLVPKVREDTWIGSLRENLYWGLGVRTKNYAAPWPLKDAQTVSLAQWLKVYRETGFEERL